MARALWRILVGVLAVVGLLAVLAMVGIGSAIYSLIDRPRPPEPPERIVLALDLRQPLPDRPSPDPLLRRLEGGGPTLRETVQAIDRAREDEAVIGLVARFSGDRFGFAAAQELRAAIGRFRDSGRFALAYGESFGEAGAGNISYYTASAFEEVWLLPIGSVGLTGLLAQVPFAAETLEMIGLEPQVEKRGPYKTFPETFTRSDFSAENRQMVEWLVDDLFEQLVTGIAEDRALSADTVAALIDRAPLTAAEALDNGLVDRLAEPGRFESAIEERAGEGSGTLGPLAYLAVAGEPEADPDARLALIYATGMITSGTSQDDPVLGPVLMGADTISRLIDEAIADDEIDGIIMRVDSGGGSASASAIIGGAVERAREAGKPLIVSMGSTAASGGYWISTHAAEIVADPATLTGSIGVFSGKIVVRQLMDELGVDWGRVGRGAHAGIFSPLDPFSASERDRLDTLIDVTYRQFLERVAEGRDMPLGEVEKIAGGRVWTGAQAERAGLVDRLGGLDVALEAARESLGLQAAAPVALIVRPRPVSPIERLLGLVGGGSGGGGAVLAELERRYPGSAGLLETAMQLEWLRSRAAEPLMVMPDLAVSR